MHHRLLLGSTALVSAGLLLGGAAPAQAEIEVTLGGYTEFEAIGATDETYQDSPDRGYGFAMDNEVHIQATGTSDTGVTYGSYLELEVGSGNATSTNAFVDEVNLFFSGNFGRTELGQQDGAEDVMFVGGEDAQSGTGGVDGDTKNLASVINVRNSGDDAKVTYFTPRVAGFQLGASYLPGTGPDQAGDNNQGEVEQFVGFGGNWVGAFGGIDLTLSAVGLVADGETGNTDDRRDYSIGGLIGVGGLSFGATWGQLTRRRQGQVRPPRPRVRIRRRQRQRGLQLQRRQSPLRQGARVRGQRRHGSDAGCDLEGGRLLQHERSGVQGQRRRRSGRHLVGRAEPPDGLLGAPARSVSV